MCSFYTEQLGADRAGQKTGGGERVVGDFLSDAKK